MDSSSAERPHVGSPRRDFKPKEERTLGRGRGAASRAESIAQKMGERPWGGEVKKMIHDQQREKSKQAP